MTKDEFAAKVASADEDDITALCMGWLLDEAKDYGRDGKHAQILLHLAWEMLE